MKKLLIVLLLIFLTACTGQEEYPSIIDTYIDTGLSIDGESIYYHKMERTDIGIYCDATNELVLLYKIENIKYYIKPVQVEDTECYSDYYMYDEIEEGYDNIYSIWYSGRLTIEQLETVDWPTVVYATSLYLENQVTLDTILTNIANEDLVKLLNAEKSYCLTNTCSDNQEFMISDFPGLESEFQAEYDFLNNNGVILVRVNQLEWHVYLEPVGTEYYEFPQGSVITSLLNEDETVTPVQDQD